MILLGLSSLSYMPYLTFYNFAISFDLKTGIQRQRGLEEAEMNLAS